MESFSQFFKTSTPNTRAQHQNPIRSLNRKHQNQVAYKYGYKGQKEDPFINNIIKYKKYGNWTISPIDGQRIATTYRIKHNPLKPYSKSINKTGITLNFTPAKEEGRKGKFSLFRPKPKNE
jgi:hypothetical protein